MFVKSSLVALCGVALCACTYPNDPPVVGLHIEGSFGAAALEEDTSGAPRAGLFRSGFTTPGRVEVDYNLDGAADEALAYELGLEGTLRVEGQPVAEVSLDGQLMIGGNLNPSEPRAGLTIGAAARSVRGTGSFAFQGQYLLCALGGNALTGEYWTHRSLGTADGNDQFVTGILAHSEGLTGSSTQTFAVHDGDVLMDAYAGTITFDGRVAVLSHPSDPSGELVVAIRKSVAAQPTLAGAFAGYVFRNEFGATRTARIALAFDGAGGVTFEESRSDGSTARGAFAYASGADGSVFVDGGAWAGIASGDGRIVALVDTDRSDGGIGYLLAVRRG